MTPCSKIEQTSVPGIFRLHFIYNNSKWWGVFHLFFLCQWLVPTMDWCDIVDHCEMWFTLIGTLHNGFICSWYRTTIFVLSVNVGICELILQGSIWMWNSCIKGLMNDRICSILYRVYRVQNEIIKTQNTANLLLWIWCFINSPLTCHELLFFPLTDESSVGEVKPTLKLFWAEKEMRQSA